MLGKKADQMTRSLLLQLSGVLTAVNFLICLLIVIRRGGKYRLKDAVIYTCAVSAIGLTISEKYHPDSFIAPIFRILVLASNIALLTAQLTPALGIRKGGPPPD